MNQLWGHSPMIKSIIGGQQEESSLIPDSELISIVLKNETKVMILANVENKDY